MKVPTIWRTDCQCGEEGGGHTTPWGPAITRATVSDLEGPLASRPGSLHQRSPLPRTRQRD
jgi:hypothetical protein